MAKTYYPLTHDEFLERSSELKDAELRVYLYLMTLNPFPDSVMEIDTARISEHLELTRRTIQRAIKRLQELQLIEIEITKFKYKKVVHGSSSRLGSGDTRIATKNSGDPYVAKGDPYVVKGDPYVATNDTRIVSNDIWIANTPLNPLSDKYSETPHTLKYSNFIKTLSEGERESFLNFGKKKAAGLPKPPELPLKWIEINFEELKNLWEKHTSTSGSINCEVASSTFVLDFESWDKSTHEGQYHTLMNLGLAKFCENTISKAWYEWAVVKYSSKFVDVPD